MDTNASSNLLTHLKQSRIDKLYLLHAINTWRYMIPQTEVMVWSYVTLVIHIGFIVVKVQHAYAKNNNQYSGIF